MSTGQQPAQEQRERAFFREVDQGRQAGPVAPAIAPLSQHEAPPRPNTSRRGGRPQRRGRGRGASRRNHPSFRSGSQSYTGPPTAPTNQQNPPQNSARPLSVHAPEFAPHGRPPQSNGPPRQQDRPQYRKTDQRSSHNRRNKQNHPSSPTELATDLSTALSRESYECIICYDPISRSTATWSCPTCFRVFDLKCINSWISSEATSSPAFTSRAKPPPSSPFRCPGCQAQHRAPPSNRFRYKCFCGKRLNPESDPAVTPHSCGETCGRSRGQRCRHPCPERCHPGPCPPCAAMAHPVACLCRNITVVRRCAEQSAKDCTPPRCAKPCGKVLQCGREGHVCQKVCHRPGECDQDECATAVEVTCHCGRETTQLPCYSSGNGYICDADACEAPLTCGNHTCKQRCHPGPCSPCPTDPTFLHTCPCGKSSLLDLEPGNTRTSCLDPVPTCGKLCNTKLERCLTFPPHQCRHQCGHGSDTVTPCPPCTETISIYCRCGSRQFQVSCGEDPELLQQRLVCDQICGDKRDCRKHKCTTVCCPARRRKLKADEGVSAHLWKDIRVDLRLQPPSSSSSPQAAQSHHCREVCGRQLSCGSHQCDLRCGHPGPCPSCGILLREDLHCACGTQVIRAPYRCGTAEPICHMPCSKQERSCGHPCPDECHSGPCPPCSINVKKFCIGGHGESRFVPCFITEVKCASICAKPLICLQHSCTRSCHSGACIEEALPSPRPDEGRFTSAFDEPSLVSLVDSEDCSPVPTTQSCGNPCGLKRDLCGHPCQSTCHPGRPCPDVSCSRPIQVYCECRRQSTTAECGRGGGGHLEAAAALDHPEVQFEVRLKCNDECARAQRAQAFAEATGLADTLAIKAQGTEQYSEFLMDYAASDMAWVETIERGLASVVLRVKPKVVFEDLPKMQRVVIEELSGLYGLEARWPRTKPHGIPNKLKSVTVSKADSAESGVLPRLPSTPLSKARQERCEKERRERLDVWCRRIWVSAYPTKQQSSMECIAKLLKPHEAGCTVLSSNDVAKSDNGRIEALVEFSTKERLSAALSGFRLQPGVTTREATQTVED